MQVVSTSRPAAAIVNKVRRVLVLDRPLGLVRDCLMNTLEFLFGLQKVVFVEELA